MRPWNVFIAQVLQLEDQLGTGGAPGKPAPSTVAAGFQHVDKLVGSILAKSRSAALVAEALQTDRKSRAARPSKGTLVAAGIRELPPAGYLSVSEVPDRTSVSDFATLMFGNRVDVAVREVRPDYIAHAVEEAQHMDRIPLDGGGPTPKIDVLVPVRDLVDLDPLRPASDYGWVAFVRRREEPPAPVTPQQPDQLDAVEVYLVEISSESYEEIQAVIEEIVRNGGHSDAEHMGVVTYPAGRWAVPVDKDLTSAYDQVQSRLSAGVMVRAVVGLTTSPARRPLAAVRAARMAMPGIEDESRVGWGPTYVGLARTEAVFLVLAPPPAIG
jgi:hypothetical protein